MKVIAKLLKDGFVNGVGLGIGLIAVSLFEAQLAGLIAEIIMTVITRVIVEISLKTEKEEMDFEISCDILGFAIANVAILLGTLANVCFPFMGAIVAMLTTSKVVSKLP